MSTHAKLLGVNHGNGYHASSYNIYTVITREIDGATQLLQGDDEISFEEQVEAIGASIENSYGLDDMLGDHQLRIRLDLLFSSYFV